MAEKMKQYIEEQPGVWSGILKERKALTGPFLRQMEGRSASQIVLLGSGSSMNASLAAKELFEELLGAETKVLMPTRMGHWYSRPEDTLVIAVSQSGKSTSTMHAVTELQAKGYEVTAMTSDGESPLAKACDGHILIGCGEESVGPKTKGMTATILTLYVTAMGLAELWGRKTEAEQEVYLSNLELSFGYAAENTEKCYEFCGRHVKTIASYPHFTWVSDGEGYAVGMESALKVLETLYVPSFCYEFEEYLHGVNNTIGPGECYFWIPSTAENRDRFMRLRRFCGEKGCDGYLVASGSLPETDEKTLCLKGSGMWYTQPFETMIFAQVLSAVGSEEKKINCDKPKFPEFYQFMNTKLQK